MCFQRRAFVACTYTLPSGSGVCTSTNRRNNLVIYSWAGGANPLVEMYESKCLFDDSAYTSVPMINSNGDVIMSDDHVIARIDYNAGTSSYPTSGSYTWCQTLPNSGSTTSCAGAGAYVKGGDSISPVLLNDGYIVAIATQNPGWVYAFYVDTGTPVGPAIQVTDASMNTYETLNTPAASYYTGGTRFYVSMSEIGVPSDALLAAIDVNTGSGTLTNTWTYTDAAFTCPCGASPAVLQVGSSTTSVIYFDGSGYIFSVVDNGSSGSFNSGWTGGPTLLSGSNVPVSGSIDKGNGRNCLWEFTTLVQTVYCVDLSTGAIDEQFSVRSITGLSHAVPSSDMSLTQASGGDVVMILGVVGGTLLQTGQVIAIDLSGSSYSSYWSGVITLGTSGQRYDGQFPIITDAGTLTPVLVFPTNMSRASFYE